MPSIRDLEQYLAAYETVNGAVQSQSDLNEVLNDYVSRIEATSADIFAPAFSAGTPYPDGLWFNDYCCSTRGYTEGESDTTERSTLSQIARKYTEDLNL